ncbi:uncharacterized protein IL334_001674 [Kwoniella shivajii]|uniref:Mid2 domain-containing protein n=1 Tax=Kwoniella shivajii TaxID=564305 RepID=A0ABZ1CSY3_9TREE|nr:hypothetical protein IL334_001674 [Kwoniella shivajii]
MISSYSLKVIYLMFLHIPYFALAQSSVTSPPLNPTRATASSNSVSVTATTSNVVYTGTPSLVFGTVQTMTACASGVILFNLYNEDPSKLNITLYAINQGIDQSIPQSATSAVVPQASRISTASSISSQVALATSPRPISATSTGPSLQASPNTLSTPTVSRRSLAERTILGLNITLVTQYANHGWSFNPVRLPEGRYYILGVVHDNQQTTSRSNIFSVIEGEDISCLAPFSSLSSSALAHQTKSASPSFKTNSTASSIGTENNNESDDPKQTGLGGGTIGGIVAGVIVGLIALVLLLICCRRRRRNQSDNEKRGFTSFAVSGRKHHKMPSEITSPSEQDHAMINNVNDKNPIAMTPVRNNGSRSGSGYESDEKRNSLNSIQNVIEDFPPQPRPHPFATPRTFDQAYDTPSITRYDDDKDPFTTPTLGEIPTMSPMYSNDEVRKFSSAENIFGMNMTKAQPVYLANVRRSSQEESPNPFSLNNKKNSSTTLGFGPNPGSGLGLRVAPPLKSSTSTNSSSSLPYSSKKKSLVSEPEKQRSTPSSDVQTSTRAGVTTSQGQGSGHITPPGNGNTPGGLSRSASSRRKPVPSLGAELRTELARQGSMKDLKGRPPKSDRRTSYKLMPDPPIIQE